MNQESLATQGKQDGPAPVTRRATDLKLGTAFVETRHGSTVILARRPRPASGGRVVLNWVAVTATGLVSATGVMLAGETERIVIDYAGSLAALIECSEYAESDAERDLDAARVAGDFDAAKAAGDAAREARYALTRLTAVHAQIAERASGIAA